MTSKVELEAKKFLDRNKKLLTPKSTSDEFLELVKQENIRQIKQQLAVDLAPLLNRLATIETQQKIIIQLLKNKLDFDVYEKRIFDLLEAELKRDK